MLWLMRTERRRRRAFALAAGVQANGYPAFLAYRGLNASTMMYLDGRMRTEMMATAEDMVVRAARLHSGGPLRLAHSGRLEPMKGAQDLLPLADRLAALGVDFTLDVFGAGSLEAGLRDVTGAMRGRLRLHAPVDFDTVLVPWMRANADIFVSCHRQADPSCTYLESMGCGVPVIGHDNAMWAALQAESGSGWVVPMADTSAMAAAIVRLSRDRTEITHHARTALGFAQRHDVETEFSQRMQHLAKGR